MKNATRLLCFLVAPALFGAPISPLLTLFNFQSTLTIETSGNDYAGFAFLAQPGFSIDSSGNMTGVLYLPGTSLSSSGGEQSIRAHTSADFTTTPGYVLQLIILNGSVRSDGPLAGGSAGISMPCTISVGSDNGGIPCKPPGSYPDGVDHGTVSADMSLYSSNLGADHRADLVMFSGLTIQFNIEAVANPEPTPALMVLAGLALLGVRLLFAGHSR